jgi:hypothetical protein
MDVIGKRDESCFFTAWCDGCDGEGLGKTSKSWFQLRYVAMDVMGKGDESWFFTVCCDGRHG